MMLFCLLLDGNPQSETSGQAAIRETVIDAALKAVLTRFQNLVEDDAMLGRWSDA